MREAWLAAPFKARAMRGPKLLFIGQIFRRPAIAPVRMVFDTEA